MNKADHTSSIQNHWQAVSKGIRNFILSVNTGSVEKNKHFVNGAAAC